MRIALPVETIVRELKGKLWLALNFIDNGHEVIFGELSSIKQGLDVIQPDVFFRTSTVYSQQKIDQNRYLKDNGASIVVLDTEGGAFKTANQYRDRRLYPEMLETVDRFFAWGNKSASVVNSTEGLSQEKTIVTGNPRFDVLQSHLRHIYEKEALEIKDDFGEFLLVNTNFGRVNSHDTTGPVREDTPEGKLFHTFIQLCYQLNDYFPDVTVIIRPHPGENHDTYEREFDNNDQIAVEHYGDVRSWIFGSEAVIHNNCTTGIEAALMQRPVYAYTPLNVSRDHMHLSNDISQEVSTIDKLRSEITTVRAEQRTSYPLTEEKKQNLKQYIYNVDCSATDRITAEVDQLNGGWTGSRNIRPPISDRVKRAGIRYLGVDKTEKVIMSLTGRDYSKLRQKFPRLTEQDLLREINRFDKNIDCSGVEISQLESLGYVYTLSKN